MTDERIVVDRDGYITLPSGYRVKVAEGSYYGLTHLPTLHFHGTHWENQYEIRHPEVAALEGSTPASDYCMPPGAEVKITQDQDCHVIISVYAKEVRGGPVMKLIFPAPDDEGACVMGTWLYNAAFCYLQQQSPDRFAEGEMVVLGADAQR